MALVNPSECVTTSIDDPLEGWSGTHSYSLSQCSPNFSVASLKLQLPEDDPVYQTQPLAKILEEGEMVGMSENVTVAAVSIQGMCESTSKTGDHGSTSVYVGGKRGLKASLGVQGCSSSPPSSNPVDPAFKPLSLDELRRFDGQVPDLPIYLAIQGFIYDVSESREVYGPGGGYHAIAGRDATWSLAKGTPQIYCAPEECSGSHEGGIGTGQAHGHTVPGHGHGHGHGFLAHGNGLGAHEQSSHHGGHPSWHASQEESINLEDWHHYYQSRYPCIGRLRV